MGDAWCWYPPEIFSGAEEEEEGDPGEVDDDLLFLGDGLLRHVKGLEDGYWYWSELVRRRRVFLHICHKP